MPTFLKKSEGLEINNNELQGFRKSRSNKPQSVGRNSKITAQGNEVDRKGIHRAKSCFSEKINRIGKPLSKLIKVERRPRIYKYR